MRDTEPLILTQTATALIRSLMQDGRARTRADVSLEIPEIDIDAISKSLHHLTTRGEIRCTGLGIHGLRQYQIAENPAASDTPALVARSTSRTQNKPRANGDQIPTAPIPTTPSDPAGPQMHQPDENLAQPQKAPAEAETSPAPDPGPVPGATGRFDDIHPSALSPKHIAQADRCFNQLIMIVIDAVVEGYGGHPATKQLAQAAVAVGAALGQEVKPWAL